MGFLGGSPLFVRLSDCPYTAMVRALSGGLGGGEKRVQQKLEDAQVTKWRHKAMWLCDSATCRFFLVPGWALPGGCDPAWLAAGWAWPWLAGPGPGWLGMALVAHTARAHKTHISAALFASG